MHISVNFSCQVIYSQFGLAIHQNDHQARRRFVEWAQNEIAVVPNFHKRILFSDEAHFWLNGYVNKQNCRIWSEANPQVYVETPLHPEKLTVWCALWAGGIIGPYFFKNDEGRNVTVNGDRYRAMITNFFIPELNNHDVQELWFQQDGATCHTARATIDLLKDTFGGLLISRFGPVNWPPRYCDLTPLDYFLWSYVKSLVYADKPQTLDHLEDNIRRVIADIRPQMLEKIIENWTSRLDYIRASRGSAMTEIIFKIQAQLRDREREREIGTRLFYEEEESISNSSHSEEESMEILKEKPQALDEKLEIAIYSKTKILYCSTKKSTSFNKIMKQEMQLFGSTENPSPNIIKLCEALKTFPLTSVEAKRAFSAAGLFVTKLRTMLSDKSTDFLCFLKSYFKNE
ncbi:transposable element Tc3 transposase [Trichonephila clavipes]|nr:transposable element Tc3 transposase [Trichonephila clavipes]